MKPNVLLDLDETIIHSVKKSDIDPNKKRHQEKLAMFKNHNMDDEYIVFERPYLQDFLDFLFKHYNVSIWTAASGPYAEFIRDEIVLSKPDRKIDLFMYDVHTNYTADAYNGGKDLRMLYIFPDYKPRNTLIIDDQDYVYVIQKDNCYQIPEWHAMQPRSQDDRELLKARDYLEKRFKTENRALLEEKLPADIAKKTEDMLFDPLKPWLFSADLIRQHDIPWEDVAKQDNIPTDFLKQYPRELMVPYIVDKIIEQKQDQLEGIDVDDIVKHPSKYGLNEEELDQLQMILYLQDDVRSELLTDVSRTPPYTPDDD